MRFSRLESSFRVCFELYAKLHLDYLPPGRISDNVVIGLFYKPLGPIPRADNPQGSTVRGIGTTSDFPGGNHIEVSAARTGNHTGFPRGGQQLLTVYATSGVAKVRGADSSLVSNVRGADKLSLDSAARTDLHRSPGSRVMLLVVSVVGRRGRQ